MKRITAGEIMKKDILSIPETMSVSEAASFLVEQGISGAPVVNGEGTLTGVVSLTDIATSASEGNEVRMDRSSYYVRGWEEDLDPEEIEGLHHVDEGQAVSEIMTPAVFTVPLETTVPLVAQTMIAGRIHRLFVTDSDDRVAGIVTTLDLLALIAGQATEDG